MAAPPKAAMSTWLRVVVQTKRNGGSENQSRRSKLSGFSFAVMRQIINSFYFELLLCYLMSAIGMNRQECKHK